MRFFPGSNCAVASAWRKSRSITPVSSISLLMTRLTVYDASYLWLSRQFDAELVTLDKALDRSRTGR